MYNIFQGDLLTPPDEKVRAKTKCQVHLVQGVVGTDLPVKSIAALHAYRCTDQFGLYRSFLKPSKYPGCTNLVMWKLISFILEEDIITICVN